MLLVRDLNLHIGGLKILNDLSFDVQDGSITGLIGPNGAGKSSFYNVLFNLFPASGGSIKLDGIELIGKTPDQISHLGIARTFQDSKLLPQITVLENMLLSSKYLNPVNLRRVFFGGGILSEEFENEKKKARVLLKKVGLEDKEHSLAKNLSYGQSKLIETLRLFMYESKLVLMDEPFSGLFPEMIKVIKGLIRELVASGRTLMFVEHDMKLIAEICDHVIVLDAGSKIAEGTFEHVKTKPEVIEAYLGD
ncbi:ABC transporter ATP-binding protein [Patescibacteria group bacterium]|nr:ABC transporter ATP-binding protein [Patescibacteria group bacterium]MBU1016507.1 ABC transporter ATP-binding protein [Patescibacteria group bacterium]MBU1685114.1 ABC transporter ATP-binding protein [Patescibacteria group bacterium]MBU1938614.1 ABC transporter ATP-binding protein [Patescibacteria group bacterium]